MDSNLQKVGMACKEMAIGVVGIEDYNSYIANNNNNNNNNSKRVINNNKGGGKNGAGNNQHSCHDHVERGLECPRCESSNTKFCYFNNYSKTQPRHFCKNCRRYWTQGGALRNVPIGGGCRKNNHSTNPNHTPNPSPNPYSHATLHSKRAHTSASDQQLASDTSSSISSCKQLKIISDNQQLDQADVAGLAWYIHSGYGSAGSGADLFSFPSDNNPPAAPYTLLDEQLITTTPPAPSSYLHPGDDWSSLNQPSVLQYMKEEAEFEPLASVELAEYHHVGSNILPSLYDHRQPPAAISSPSSSELVNNNARRVASSSSSSTANTAHHDANPNTTLAWMTMNGPATFLWPTDFDH